MFKNCIICDSSFETKNRKKICNKIHICLCECGEEFKVLNTKELNNITDFKLIYIDESTVRFKSENLLCKKCRKERHYNKIKEKWKDPNYKEAIKRKTAETNKDINVRKRRSESLKRAYKNMVFPKIKCHICNEMFQPNHNMHKICYKNHFTFCSKCGKKIEIKSMTSFRCDDKPKNFSRSFKIINKTKETTFIKFEDNELCKDCKREQRINRIKASRDTENFKNKLKKSLKNRKFGKSTCKICGKSFIKDSSSQLYCKRKHLFKCSECNKIHNLSESFSRFKKITNNFKNIKLDEDNLLNSDQNMLCSKCNVKNKSLSKETKEKISKSLRTKESKGKRKRTLKEKYGCDIYQQSEHYKQHNRDTFIKSTHTKDAILKKKNNYKNKYGIEWPSQNKEVYDKIINTQLKKYGCFHSQTKEFREYMSELTSKNLSNQKQYSNALRCYYIVNGKRSFLRSSYEFIYALYLSLLGIDFNYESIFIKYKDRDGIDRYYKPDFIIGDKIIETKGYFSDKDKENFKYIEKLVKI